MAKIDVGFLLFTGEGFAPGQIEESVPLLDIGRMAEQAGFSTIGVEDHLRWERDEGPHGFWESTTILSALAVATSTVRLTTSVLNMPFRNPALVAKIAESIDMLSGGRFTLGLGAGGGPDIEYESFGFDHDHLYGRFVEALTIIRTLLHDGAIDFEGRYYRAPGCVLRPRGPRPSGLPIAIGADGPKMMRLVARFADEWNGFTLATATPDLFVPMLKELERACIEVGRDPADLRRSVDILVAPTAVCPPLPAGFGSPIHGGAGQIAKALVAFADVGIDEVRTYLWPQSRAAVESMREVIAELS